jgi:Mg-chelatase subunit ChlD
MIALDVSPSMRDGVNAPLTQASATLERFLGRETGFRFGLVTFAGSALTRLPPTTDPRLLSATLGTAAAGVSDDGTAIGTAIGLAGARLRSTEAHGRAVILLTDGLHNAGAVDPVTAAAIAREDGATVHAIVLEGAPVEGRRLLREIVTAGGGRLVESSSAEEALEAALAELVPVRGEAGPPERRAAWGGLLFGAVVLLLMGEAVRTLRPGVER